MKVTKQQIMIIIAITILLTGFFYFGAYSACGGKLINGFKCGEIEIIGACQDLIKQRTYRIDPNLTYKF